MKLGQLRKEIEQLGLDDDVDLLIETDDGRFGVASTTVTDEGVILNIGDELVED